MKFRKKIFERKSTKVFLEEDPRKNLSAKIRLEKSVKQFFKKIDKYIKASIACSENASIFADFLPNILLRIFFFFTKGYTKKSVGYTFVYFL